jgi:SAM-dependent methyltransferase
MSSRQSNQSLFTRLRSRLYALTDYDGWYRHYKLTELPRLVEAPFNVDSLPLGYARGLDERAVEYPWLFSRLPGHSGRLLDAGSVLNHDFLVGHPKLAEKTTTIMTLAPEDVCFWQEGISYVYGDLRDTCFRDDYFDYIVSLSTLEHIGLNNTLFYTNEESRNEQDPTAFLPAVTELRRILKPGGLCFMSVPFGKKCVHEWLQIFDGDMVDSMIEKFQPGFHAVTYFQYSGTKGWQLSDRHLARDAAYFDPLRGKRLRGGALAAEAVACLELKK